MKKARAILSIFLILFCSSSKASIEALQELAPGMLETRVLTETRSFLKRLYDQQKKGEKIDKKEALAIAFRVEQIAIYGSRCKGLEQENVLRSQHLSAMLFFFNSCKTKRARHFF